MKQVTKVAIIGGGMIGQAVGGVLSRSGRQVEYWDKDPTKATVKGLAEALDNAQLVMLAVPSAANSSVAAEVAEHWAQAQDRLVVSLAKGVAPGFVSMDKVLAEAADGRFDHGLLFGPMLAPEIAAGKDGYGILAVSDKAWFDSLSDLKGLRLSYTGDTNSVGVAGALKNIYAIGFGLSDGLDLGANTKGALTTGAVEEMSRFMTELGADSKVVLGYAGLGDLLATGWGDESFNYRIGKALAEGIASSEHSKGEGVNAAREAAKVVDLKRYPIMAAIYKIALKNQDPKIFKDVIDGH